MSGPVSRSRHYDELRQDAEWDKRLEWQEYLDSLDPDEPEETTNPDREVPRREI